MSNPFFPKNISPRDFIAALGLWWRRWSSLVFSLLFFLVLGISVFSWYKSLYMFRWSEDEEREYRLSKSKQVKFQREKFDVAIGMLSDRAKQHESAPGVFRDLFFGQ